MRSACLLLLPTLLLIVPGCTDRHPGSGVRAGRLSGADQGPSVCSAACQSVAPYLCVKDAQKRCVECTGDEHCKKNPAALGTTCDKKLGICRCADSAACAGKVHGKQCLTAPPRAPMCGCSADAHCCAGRRCVQALHGGKVCAAPCKADKDCPSPARPHCDAASGACLQCTGDTHCGGKYTPRCAKGRCVACTSDAHCSLADKPRCDDGVCAGCSGDKHCSGSASGGLRCLARDLEPRRCGCQVDADCKGSDLGPTCHVASGRCSCAADTQCKASGKGVCAPPFIGAGYSRCGAPCKAKTECGRGLVCDKTSGRCGQCKGAADCGSTAFAQCDTASMRCVACLADSHCSGTTPLCDTTAGRCVACKTAAQCSASPLGPVCAAGACTCAADKDCGAGGLGKRCVSHGAVTRCGCAADADCASSSRGPTCFTTYKRCSCKTDADCKTAPLTKCLLAYPNAVYKVCTRPCATDKDCPNANAGRCDPTSGRCFPCTKTTHCAGERWAKICHPYTHRCVECAVDPNCNTQTLGKGCKNTLCGCKAGSDCTSNVHGKLCDKYYQVCSCATDKDCPTGKKCEKTTLGTKIRLCK